MSLLKLLEQYAAKDDATIPIREDDVLGTESIRREPVLYAATNLEAWETDEPNHYARDVGIAGTCFRWLDPDYYTWLRYKMDLARKAAGARRITAQAFDALRTRFNVIHTWAIEHFGEEALRRTASRKTASGRSRNPFGRRPCPRSTQSATRRSPSAGARPNSTRTGGASVFPAARTTASSASSRTTNALAK